MSSAAATFAFADIAGFTFPLPMEAIDAIMALSFTQ